MALKDLWDATKTFLLVTEELQRLRTELANQATKLQQFAAPSFDETLLVAAKQNDKRLSLIRANYVNAHTNPSRIEPSRQAQAECN